MTNYHEVWIVFSNGGSFNGVFADKESAEDYIRADLDKWGHRNNSAYLYVSGPCPVKRSKPAAPGFGDPDSAIREALDLASGLREFVAGDFDEEIEAAWLKSADVLARIANVAQLQSVFHAYWRVEAERHASEALAARYDADNSQSIINGLSRELHRRTAFMDRALEAVKIRDFGVAEALLLEVRLPAPASDSASDS